MPAVLSEGQANDLRALAESDRWLSNSDLLSRVGAGDGTSREAIALVSSVLGLREARRRDVVYPYKYLRYLSEYAALVGEYAVLLEGSPVTYAGFQSWLAERGRPALARTQHWRVICDAARVQRPPRERPVYSYGELVEIMNRFLSSEDAPEYTLPAFKRWSESWHGADLSHTVRNVLGDGRWPEAKGMIFKLRQDGHLSDDWDSEDE